MASLPAGNYHYNLVISGDYDIMNSEVIAYPEILLNERHDFTIRSNQIVSISPPIWDRDRDMTCSSIWINADNALKTFHNDMSTPLQEFVIGKP